MLLRDRDDIYIEHPNREKAGSKLTRLTVIVLLVASAVLLIILSVGGWERLAGAQALQVFYIVLYLGLALFVARWSRGVLPVAAALAIILFIFAAVSGPGWYARDNDGFAQTTLDAALMGFLCIVLAIVQIVLILFAMRGFQQAWNVEVERSRDEYEAGRGERGSPDDRRGRGGRGGRGKASAAPA